MNGLTPSAAKIVALPALLEILVDWRSKHNKIVFTNGCFDLLHVGHVDYLEKARNLGDKLVLGLNSDASVSRLKGPTRPLNNAEARARVLAALASVDAVVVFEDDTPLALIQAVMPDVLVKGGDYTEAQVVGAKEVRAHGGEVALIPFVEGFSTTGIIQKMGPKP